MRDMLRWACIGLALAAHPALAQTEPLAPVPVVQPRRNRR